MDNELVKRLDDFVRVRLTEKRYKHTEGVIETSARLAERYGADADKTYIAALFHDACKNLDNDELNMLVEKYNIGEVYIDKPQLSHSKLAAAILREEFGVDDEEIINAVSYHTTGRADMSLLEKIIFTADATEPNRTYEEADRLNSLAFYDLDRACYEILVRTQKRVEDGGAYLDPDTVRAREWMEKVLSHESLDDSRNFAVFSANILNERKAFDISVLDISEKSSFSDYFVIASGNSDRQVKALAEAIEDKAAEQGITARGIEGRDGSGWVLMDYGDVIINVFLPENREK